MTRYLLISLLIITWSQAEAQYIPNSSQPFQFASMYNPAFVGVEEFSDVKVGYRTQMTGFGPNSPKFINIMGNFRLRQPLDLATHSLRIGSAKLSDPNFIPKYKRIIHGLGINVFNEKSGFFDKLGGGISYAFHYPLSNKMRLALGVNATVENRKLDMSGYYPGVNAEVDLLLTQLANGSSQMDINARAGFLLYGRQFYIGASYLSLYNTAESADLETLTPYYRGVAQTGFSFSAGEGLVLQPSAVAVLQVDNELLIDYSLKARIKEKIWTGITYRDIEAAVIGLGFDFNSTMGVSYSYEMSTGDFKQFNDGSHELVLCIRLNNFKHATPYTW